MRLRYGFYLIPHKVISNVTKPPNYRNMSLKYNTLLPEHSKQHTGTQNCLHQTHQLLWVPFTKPREHREGDSPQNSIYTAIKDSWPNISLHKSCISPRKARGTSERFPHSCFPEEGRKLLQTRLRRDHLAVPHGAAWQNLAILDFIVGLKKNQQRKLRTPSKLSLKWRLCKCH